MREQQGWGRGGQSRAGRTRGRIGSRCRVREEGHLGAGWGVVASMMETRTPPGGMSPMDGQSSGKVRVPGVRRTVSWETSCPTPLHRKGTKAQT